MAFFMLFNSHRHGKKKTSLDSMNSDRMFAVDIRKLKITSGLADK